LKKSRIPAWLGLAASLAGAQTVVNLDPAETRQEFEGWGSSLCWWGNQVGRWSDANLSALVGKITDPDTGLGYSLFRYNIGGGDQPGHSHLAQFKALPGYKPTEAGPYDWSADPYQRKVAAMLQKRGRNVAVEEDWVVMFTPECRPLPDDDAELIVAAPAEHLRLMDRGAALVSSHEPVFVHVAPPSSAP